MNDSRRGRWARAASLASVFLALLLAPLLVAQAANAADQPTVQQILKLGSDRTCTKGFPSGSSYPADGTCLIFAAESEGSNNYIWEGFDTSGPDLPVDGQGRPTIPIQLCYLDSGNGGQVQCGSQTIWSQSMLSNFAAKPAGFDSHKYWINWGESKNDIPTFAGTLCISLDYSHKCNTAYYPDGYGAPNDNEIGHRALTGDFDKPLPGQQEDGSIDPIACIQQSLSAASDPNAFDPIGYIFTPVKCAFLWATTMPTNTVTTLVNGQTQRWSGTQLGATVNSLDFYSAFSLDNGCRGIVIDLSGLRTPGGPAVADLRLLNACSGDMLAPLAGLVKIGLTLAVLLGGAFAIARMVSQFVKGPTPGPAHASDFDDVLMGR